MLVTGASGFLGWNLCVAARESHIVAGTVFSHRLTIAGVDLHSVDLRIENDTAAILDAVLPDVVIHTAGMSKPGACEAAKDDSYDTNVCAAAALAELCARKGIRLIYTSTDMVFDGMNPPYSETSTTSPTNTYGKHKLLAEERLLSACPGALVCRMPLMFGNPGPCAQTFIQPWLTALRSGQQLKLFTDEWRTNVSGAVAAGGLMLATDTESSGILNLGGVERISRYDFGLMLAEVFGLDASGILPVKQAEVKLSTPRPRDVSLDSSKAFTLGYNPPPIAEQLAAVREDMAGLPA